MERHNAISQALPSTKASLAKQTNLHCTLEPEYKIGNKVLLSTKNINIKNVSPKMKPLWIVPFTILLANYNCNNCSLHLSRDLSWNLMYNTFLIIKIKPYVNNNSTLFPQPQVVKPGPLVQDRYVVEKVIEYRKAPRSGVTQYNVYWLGYSLEDDQ